MVIVKYPWVDDKTIGSDADADGGDDTQHWGQRHWNITCKWQK